MSIRKKTGVIVSYEFCRKSDIIKSLEQLLPSIDAIFLKQLVMVQESTQIISEIREHLHAKGSDKPVIADWRLEESELDSVGGLSNLLKNEGAYAMTIMAIYGEDFIKACRREAKLGIFAIVDVGIQSFRNLFDDAFVIQNSVFARNNKCEGVIMTSRHLDRTKKVREAVGKDFLLLSTLEEGGKLGNGASAGADFEIVSYKLLEK